MPNCPIQTILVPAGAEYRAIGRGLQLIRCPQPQIQPIPVGPEATTRFLQTHPPEPGGVLLMGLGGSLVPRYAVGDAVLWQAAIANNPQGNLQIYNSDRYLNQWLQQRLHPLPLVQGFTSDRIITRAAEKQQLARDTGAEVVDMEAVAVLQALAPQPVAILRVISDDCHHDLPDLSQAVAADGSLRSLPLALSFLSRPRAASRLIRGSLKGLKVLEAIAQTLFSPD